MNGRALSAGPDCFHCHLFCRLVEGGKKYIPHLSTNTPHHMNGRALFAGPACAHCHFWGVWKGTTYAPRLSTNPPLPRTTWGFLLPLVVSVAICFGFGRRRRTPLVFPSPPDGGATAMAGRFWLPLTFSTANCLDDLWGRHTPHGFPFPPTPPPRRALKVVVLRIFSPPHHSTRHLTLVR